MSPPMRNGPLAGGRLYALGTAAKQNHRERSAATRVLTRDISPRPPSAAGNGPRST